jgi:type IX secretion system PorP/SprF family membrane protein
MTDNPVALVNSKDQYFHVPKMTTMDANFAAAGDRMSPRIIAMSRAQWLGESNQQIMNTLSYDTYVRSLRGGLGVQLDHSYYGKGEFSVGQIGLTYSPKIGISKNWVLEPAVRLKIGNKALTRSNLNYGDNVELDRGTVRTFLVPEGQTTSNNLWYQDVGVGMLANSKWFFVGAQVDNLAKHYNNIYSLAGAGEKNRSSIHLTTTIGTDYVSRNKNISISPYILYQKTEKLSEIWGGTIFRYKKFTLGGAYSSLGDYAGSIGIKTNRFMLTYNADATASALLGKQIMSHQMILRILIKNDQNGQRMLKL